MSTLAEFDIPFTDIEQQVMDMVAEAFELRHGVASDPEGRIRDAPHETMQEVENLLSRVRSRADRVDELFTRVTLARGRAKRAMDESNFAAERALHEATRHRSARRVEFSSGREREAEAKLDSFDERFIAHQAERLVSVTNDAYTVLSQMNWQLDAIRKDLRAQLHALQFESSLER